MRLRVRFGVRVGVRVGGVEQYLHAIDGGVERVGADGATLHRDW